VALPETDLARIKKWCDSIWPQHMWDQAKVEADVAPAYVTIVEVRPDWMVGPVPTRFPIARLRYTKTTGQWAIYWAGPEPEVPPVPAQAGIEERAVPARLHPGEQGPNLLRVVQSPRPIPGAAAVLAGSSGRSGVRRTGSAPSTTRSGSTAVCEMS
jgi:hypothetical protein